jgi:hypothetical protein
MRNAPRSFAIKSANNNNSGPTSFAADAEKVGKQKMSSQMESWEISPSVKKQPEMVIQSFRQRNEKQQREEQSRGHQKVCEHQVLFTAPVLNDDDDNAQRTMSACGQTTSTSETSLSHSELRLCGDSQCSSQILVSPSKKNANRALAYMVHATAGGGDATYDTKESREWACYKPHSLSDLVVTYPPGYAGARANDKNTAPVKSWCCSVDSHKCNASRCDDAVKTRSAAAIATVTERISSGGDTTTPCTAVTCTDGHHRDHQCSCSYGAGRSMVTLENTGTTDVGSLSRSFTNLLESPRHFDYSRSQMHGVSQTFTFSDISETGSDCMQQRCVYECERGTGRGTRDTTMMAPQGAFELATAACTNRFDTRLGTSSGTASGQDMHVIGPGMEKTLVAYAVSMTAQCAWHGL